VTQVERTTVGASQEDAQEGRVEGVGEGAVLQWLAPDRVRVTYRTAQDLRAALWHLAERLSKEKRISLRGANVLFLILYETKRERDLADLTELFKKYSGVTVELEKVRQIPKHLRPSQGT